LIFIARSSPYRWTSDKAEYPKIRMSASFRDDSQCHVVWEFCSTFSQHGVAADLVPLIYSIRQD
jgi:hypothetical protein